MNTPILSRSERTVFALRRLYADRGYTLYRMSKFEEYDLYSRNKDFLVSDQVITFTDTTGRLLALKPDVTLSIIKNTVDTDAVERLCYHENVYRVSGGSNRFCEIMQTGVECIGDIDTALVGENLYLAAQCLGVISDEFVLNVSNLDILLAFVERATDSRTVQDALIDCVAHKNIHGIRAVCDQFGIEEPLCAPLCALVSLCGQYETVLPTLSTLCADVCIEQAQELADALAVFEGSGYADHIHIDFSVVSDRSYYNGIIFKGFVNTVPDSVLTGGQYDRLMQRMQRRSRAIGFAVYLDMLERLYDEPVPYDADVLVLYDEGVSADMLRARCDVLIASGKSVYTSKTVPLKRRFREVIRMKGEVNARG